MSAACLVGQQPLQAQVSVPAADIVCPGNSCPLFPWCCEADEGQKLTEDSSAQFFKDQVLFNDQLEICMWFKSGLIL